MSSGPSIAMTVIGVNAVQRWLDFIGPRDSEIAKREAPDTLRAIYGTDMTKNGVHGSADIEHVEWVKLLLISERHNILITFLKLISDLYIF